MSEDSGGSESETGNENQGESTEEQLSARKGKRYDEDFSAKKKSPRDRISSANAGNKDGDRIEKSGNKDPEGAKSPSADDLFIPSSVDARASSSSGDNAGDTGESGEDD
jgi:hypothetical protein